MPMKTTFVTCSPRAASSRGDVQHLGDDLLGAKVPLEAHLAGGAEDTAHGTAGLGRDADGGPGVMARLRVLHEHGLDERAVVHAQQELGRFAVLADDAAHLRGGIQRPAELGEARGESAGQR